MDFTKLTHSGLLRFAEAVDVVVQAEDLDARERRDLIAYWVYRCREPGMLEQLKEAIERCKCDPEDPKFKVTATCRIDRVTGEEVAFNPG